MKPDVLTGQIETKSMRPVNLHSCTKEEILEYFENAYSLDEWLFTSLKDEDVFYKTPDRLRLPLIFYYAHPAVVFINKLILAGLVQERVDKHLEALFEAGVDEMSWDDTENYRMGGGYQWPSVDKARRYRLKVRELVRRVIQDTPLTLPITANSPWWAVIMGIEHERIHLETSSVLIRQLPVNFVEKPKGWKYGPLASETEVLENPMVPAGNMEVMIGNDHDSPLWGWDCEHGKRAIRVPKFEASKYLITNREFLKFVEDGGYENGALWNEEGWRWQTFRQAKHPTFWTCSQKCKSGCGSALENYSHCNKETPDGKFGLRLIFDVVPLPLDWPAEVNYHEAKAFCKWKGRDYRLPTEAEHHVMRAMPKFDSSKETISNKSDSENNSNLKYGSSTPVNMFPSSPTGFYDTYGNVWQWVEDHFNGLPGGTTHYLYDDFSTPCFDGLHTMIMGSSWISTGGVTARYNRFAFRQHFYQHLGFRLARTLDFNDLSPVVYVNSQIYIIGRGVEDNQTDLNQIAETGLKPIFTESTSTAIRNDTEENLLKLVKEQYSTSFFSDMLDFCCDYVQLVAPNGNPSRALVVGCGPGRLVFELTKAYEKVVGCDVSGRCIDFAIKLAKEESILLPNNDEKINNNTVKTGGIIHLPEGVKPERATFKQLTWLPVELGVFDLIVVDGLDRVQNKKAWLAMLQTILKDKDSIAIITGTEEEISPIVSHHITSIELKMAKQFQGKGKKHPTRSISAWKKITA